MRFHAPTTFAWNSNGTKAYLEQKAIFEWITMKVKQNSHNIAVNTEINPH